MQVFPESIDQIFYSSITISNKIKNIFLSKQKINLKKMLKNDSSHKSLKNKNRATSLNLTRSNSLLKIIKLNLAKVC